MRIRNVRIMWSAEGKGEPGRIVATISTGEAVEIGQNTGQPKKCVIK